MIRHVQLADGPDVNFGKLSQVFLSQVSPLAFCFDYGCQMWVFHLCIHGSHHRLTRLDLTTARDL